jgi:hypothetical protein
MTTGLALGMFGRVAVIALALAGCSKKDDGEDACKLSDFKTDGSIGVKWNAATQSLAYGRPDSDGTYRVYVSDVNGDGEHRVVSDAWGSDGHQFPVEWATSGKYLFVLVEKGHHGGSRADAIPGYGAYTDLWLVTPDGSQTWLLYETPGDKDHALTHARMSESGRLTWTERVSAPKLTDASLAAGSYVFNTADFVDGDPPHLESIVAHRPGDVEQGGEVDGISADGNTIAFYSTYETKNLFASRIYSWNLESDAITELSHDSFSQAPNFTPDGTGLVYMSGQEADIFPGEIQGADWWYVDAAGGNRRRLTFMNKWFHEHSINHYRLAGTMTFLNPTMFLGDVLTFPLGLVGKIVKVRCDSL